MAVFLISGIYSIIATNIRCRNLEIAEAVQCTEVLGIYVYITEDFSIQGKQITELGGVLFSLIFVLIVDLRYHRQHNFISQKCSLLLSNVDRSWNEGTLLNWLRGKNF